MNKRIIGILIGLIIFTIILINNIFGVTANKNESFKTNILKENSIISEGFILNTGESRSINFSVFQDEEVFSIDIDIRIVPFTLLLSWGETPPILNKILNESLNWNLYLYEEKKLKQDNNFNYISIKHEWIGINGDFNTTINVHTETSNQMKIKNCGFIPIYFSINIFTTPLTIPENLSTLPSHIIFFIAFISALALLLMYYFRKLIYMEKRDNHRTLEILIKNSKVNPDKVLDLLEKMNKSLDKECLKLTETLSSITSKIVNRLKRNKEYENKINKEEPISFIEQLKLNLKKKLLRNT